MPEQDWRLEAELDAADPHGTLDRLLGAVRDNHGRAVDDVRAAVAHDIAITHDGPLLFAYAQTQLELSSARRVIEGVLACDGIAASIRVSHWDSDLDAWRQSDPPLSAEETRTDEAILRTVTGPRRKLQEFRQGLKAEAIATIRADGFGTGIV